VNAVENVTRKFAAEEPSFMFGGSKWFRLN